MNHIRTTVGAFAILAALAVPLQAAAQHHPLDNRPAAWWLQLEQQLKHSLDLSIDQIQDETLQHIIYFSTHYSDKIDLSQITPKLLDIYELETNEARRTMALMALFAIGNEPSMRRLAELVEEEPAGSIRNFTLAVLAQFNNG
jgi:hypothetical protein